MKILWVLGAGVVIAGIALRRHGLGVPKDFREAAEKGYAFGIREPGELAVYVASYFWPEDTWPPSYGDSIDKESRYADVWVAVTSYLAEQDGFRG